MYLEIAFNRSEATLRAAALQKRALDKEATQRFELPVPALLTDAAYLTDSHFSLDLKKVEKYGWVMKNDDDGDFYERYYFCNRRDNPTAAGESLRLDEALAFAKQFIFTDEMQSVNDLHAHNRAARLAAEAAERQAKEVERAQIAEREKELARENEAKLRTWAQAHGSELLRRRIAGEFEWQEIARNEYATQVIATTPTLVDLKQAPSGGSSQPRREPTLAQMFLLERVQKELCSRGGAELKRVTYTDEDDGSESRRTELAVAIVTPDGETETIYFSMPPEKA